jgi:hypothetical protein
MTDPDEVIRAAEEVTGILESRGVGALVIGAVALAAHGYVRFTEDLDLGVNTDLGTLNQVADALYAGGTKSRADIVELLARNPDADMAAIRDLCQNWRLRGLDPLIEEALGEP